MSTKKNDPNGFGLEIHTFDSIYTVETTQPKIRIEAIKAAGVYVIVENGIVNEIPYHAMQRFAYRETQ